MKTRPCKKFWKFGHQAEVCPICSGYDHRLADCQMKENRGYIGEDGHTTVSKYLIMYGKGRGVLHGCKSIKNCRLQTP